MQKVRTLLLALSLVGLVSGCQSYRWYRPSESTSIYVPFVKNDAEGLLSTCVMEALVQNGFVLDRSASLELEIDLSNTRMVSMNYDYGYDESGEPTSSLYATGARQEWTCRVGVKRSGTDTYLIPLQELLASAEFDYQSDEMPYNEVQFSVGQLNIREEATSSSQRYLAKKMAQVIASWLVAHQNQLTQKKAH